MRRYSWVLVLVVLLAGPAAVCGEETVEQVAPATEVLPQAAGEQPTAAPIDEQPAAATPEKDLQAAMLDEEQPKLAAPKIDPQQLLVAILAAILVSIAVSLVKLARPKLLVAKTWGNRLLPVACILLGVLLAVVNAWWIHVPLRSTEGWGMVMDGVMVGWGAIAMQALVRTTILGK